MSNEVTTIAQKRVVGSATRKAVLMYLADRASDDGSGIWTSKAHIAADTELSKRSVQNVMNQFEIEGLLVKVGTKACTNGFTFEYRLEMPLLMALPSTREEQVRGAGGSPVRGVKEIHGVHHVHPTGAGDSPHGVHHVHPNHPLTPHEPPKERENAPNLFSASEIEPVEASKPDQIEAGFQEFWAEIWPTHKRKAGKIDCQKIYRAACEGKHPKAAKVSPSALNRAARAYIASLRGDMTYLKGPKPWLNQPGWEPYLEAVSVPSLDQLTPRQRNLLQAGQVPPSMVMENGKPSPVARHWLKNFGCEVPA